jgi:hypothetical protein
MSDDALQCALARLSPGSLRRIVLEIAATQAPDNRDGVAVVPIVEVLTEGLDLGAGSEGWQAHLRLKRAIMEAVAQVPGLKYVEADS